MIGSGQSQIHSILYIEDSPAEFARTAKLLTKLGFFLYVAENGQEGLRIYNEVKPDIIMTNLAMPVMNRLELIKEIRSADEKTQIIVTIDRSDADILFETFNLNINCYLARPVEIEQLSAALSACSDRLNSQKRSGIQQEQQHSMVVANDQCPTMITITDNNGNINYINSQFQKLSGRPAKEFIGKHVSQLFYDYGKSFQDAMIQEKSWEGELILKGENGVDLVVHSISSPVFSQNGNLKQIIIYSEDITKSKAAEEEIRKLNAELEFRVLKRTALLESTNRELDEFCDAISHELCGPLSRLQGLSKALYEDFNESLDENGRDYLQRINQTSFQLKQIIDALLNLSQLTRRGLSMQKVNLSAIAAKICDNLSSSDPGRKAKFFIAPDIVVKGDQVLLKLVMDSLLTNAWKSTEGHSPVQIEFGIARSNDKAVYFVRDNGSGFDMKYANKIFKLFNKININNNGSTESNGTELAAAQRIIQRHGGRIWAEGELDKGSTFYFTL